MVRGKPRPREAENRPKVTRTLRSLFGSALRGARAQASRSTASGARYSALPFGAADYATGVQGFDLAPGISEFRQHFSRVLAEFRRDVAQPRLGALQADRGGDPAVPVLFDDVAAVDGMGIGQRRVDRLHRPGRQSRGQQAVAERLGVVLTEHRGELGAQRLAVGDAVLVARKTHVAAELSFADLLAELAEGAVIADADKDIGGAGRENRVGHEVRMLVAGELRRLAM